MGTIKPEQKRPVRDDTALPNIFLGSRCNHDCLFCSDGIVDKTQSAETIRAVIAKGPDTLSIEGGEPTLSKDLPQWVRLAKERGVRDIILCTNGARFEDSEYVRRLLDAGVTLFNVNFPAHIERAFDLTTRTRGQFPRRIAAIGNLMRIAGDRRVRINMIVHRLSYVTLEDYVRFIRKTFPKVFYVEFNLVKVLGYVTRRTYLVPRLSQAAPVLRAAMGLMDRMGMRYICDGFPLCHLDGHEPAAIDVYKLLAGDSLYMEEKEKSPRCASCSLGALCAGPRGDYLSLHGDDEIAPSAKDPDPIRRRVSSICRR